MSDSSSKPNTPPNAPSSSSSTKTPTDINNGHTHTNKSFSGQKIHFPNPPDPTNPDPATLREQWKFAIRQYSRWYSHAWGTAILAGVSFFALGWVIKGSNPLPSLGHHDDSSPSADKTDEAAHESLLRFSGISDASSQAKGEIKHKKGQSKY